MDKKTKVAIENIFYMAQRIKDGTYLRNMLLFKYCICYMITAYDMPLEFKVDYSAIRRI